MDTVNRYHTAVTVIGASLFTLGLIEYNRKEGDHLASIEYMVVGGGIVLFGNMGVAMVSVIVKAVK